MQMVNDVKKIVTISLENTFIPAELLIIVMFTNQQKNEQIILLTQG